MSDVVAAVRHVEKVAGLGTYRWDPAPYDIVAHVLRDDFGHTDEEAHALLYEAVLAGEVSFTFAKIRTTDNKEKQLCLVEVA